jgi:hypothetical protein
VPVISLVSAKGSPGATTAAAALAAAATLTGDTLLVELDPSGGDVQILTGVEGEPGTVLAAAELRRTVSASAVEAHVTAAPPEVPALLAPTAELMASSVIASVIDRWRPALREFGGTVVVDAGRWDAAQPTARRATVGDLVAVVCRPSVASVEHARHAIDRLRAAARRPVVALVVGTKPYAPAEVAAQMEVPLGGALAWDPRGVGTLWSRGVSKSWGRTWLASSAAQSLESLLALIPDSIAEAPVARAGTGRRPLVAPPTVATPPQPAARGAQVEDGQPTAAPGSEPAPVTDALPVTDPAPAPATEAVPVTAPAPVTDAEATATDAEAPEQPRQEQDEAAPAERDEAAGQGGEPPGRTGADGPPAPSAGDASFGAGYVPAPAPRFPPPPPPAPTTVEEPRPGAAERAPVPPPPVPAHRAEDQTASVALADAEEDDTEPIEEQEQEREPATNFERFALGRARQRARNAEVTGRDRRAAQEARAARLAARVGPYAGDLGHEDDDEHDDDIAGDQRRLRLNYGVARRDRS